MKRTPLLFLLLAMLALPATADAGSYRVHSCHTPDGATASSDGWRSFRQTYQSWTSDTCASGGGLSAALFGSAAHAPNSALVGWEFSSGGREVLSWNVELVTDNSQFWTGATADVWAARPDRLFTGDNLAFLCAGYQGCTGRRVHRFGEANAPAGMRSFHLVAMCGGVAGYLCQPVSRASTTEFTLQRATFTLADRVAPVAESVGGEHGLTFVAVDPADGGAPGSGVRRVELELDGRVVQSFTPSTNGGRCPAEGSDFTHLQPCPLRTPVEIPFDPATLAPGRHVLRVRIADAAGNVSTVVGPNQIDIAGPLTQAAAKHLPERRVRLRALRKRVRAYGRMLLTGGIRAGRIERGALVEIQLRSGRSWRTIAVRRTNSNGDFRFRHRFRRTSNAVLAFRARIRPDAELPVRPLTSHTVRVRVGSRR